jgi:putative IMPACT (imprinted ancient) family translation regulator
MNWKWVVRLLFLDHQQTELNQTSILFAIIYVDTNGWKYPIFSSDRLRERKSVFLAHASTLPNPSDVSDFVSHLTSLPALKRATHCMYAYRVIPDRTSTSNKIIGQHDGGERGSGERLSRLLDVLECENVMVVVSRWYGGVPLGSDRWKMISSVAKEALNKGGFIKERTRDVTTLSNKRNSNKHKKKR